jgi:hypothetical protein
MESLFLLAFGEQEFLAALATTGSEAVFNKPLIDHSLTDRFFGGSTVISTDWKVLH